MKKIMMKLETSQKSWIEPLEKRRMLDATIDDASVIDPAICTLLPVDWVDVSAGSNDDSGEVATEDTGLVDESVDMTGDASVDDFIGDATVDDPNVIFYCFGGIMTDVGTTDDLSGDTSTETIDETTDETVVVDGSLDAGTEAGDDAGVDVRPTGIFYIKDNWRTLTGTEEGTDEGLVDITSDEVATTEVDAEPVTIDDGACDGELIATSADVETLNPDAAIDGSDAVLVDDPNVIYYTFGGMTDVVIDPIELAATPIVDEPATVDELEVQVTDIPEDAQTFGPTDVIFTMDAVDRPVAVATEVVPEAAPVDGAPAPQAVPVPVSRLFSTLEIASKDDKLAAIGLD